MRCMCRLLPLPAPNSHSSLPPEFDQILYHHRVAHCIVLTVEEEGGRSDRIVVENLDAVLVQVCCVAFEKPEVKHGSVFDEALHTWQQSLAKA